MSGLDGLGWPTPDEQRQPEGLDDAACCGSSGVEAAVCADIARRQQLGIRKYGATVATNPLHLREWLQHAYEESLDNAIYLKRAMQEISAPCGEHGGAMADCPHWQHGCCICHNESSAATGSERNAHE